MSPAPPRRPRGRRRSALLGTALLATLATVATVGAVPVAADEPDAPSVNLRVPEKLTVYSQGRHVYGDLGVRLENTGTGALEIWSTRGEPGSADRYDQDVVVTTRDAEGNATGTIPLGDHTTLNGLDDLATFTFEPVGRTKEQVVPFTSGITCLGGEGAQRISPDGPAVSPYPDYCYGGNPFTLGNVQGLPNGWASPLLEAYGRHTIPQGRWDVTVTMDDAVADALGVPASEQEQVMRLKVKPFDDCKSPTARGCRTGGGAGGSGAGEGSPGVPLQPAAEEPSDDGPTGDPLPAGTPRPDLEALPAFGMEIAPNGNYLRFSATVWNGGTSPLVVDGFNPDGDGYMDGYQYFFDADGTQETYRPVGQFEWDPRPTHQHWHFQAFAEYSLVPYGAETTPGDPEEHDHVKSKKEAFCLANTDAVDLTGEDAAWKVDNTDLATACGERSSTSIREVLAAGWGDTYSQFRAGQSFNLKKVDDGCYDIVVEGNPRRAFGDNGEDVHRTLYESDYSNNVARRTVLISTKKNGDRSVTVAGVGKVESGPTPEQLGCVAHSDLPGARR